MKRRFILIFTVPVLICGLLLLGIYIFQDNLSRYTINPRTPFLTVKKPPEPDYRRDFGQEHETQDPKTGPDTGPNIGKNAWALWPSTQTQYPRVSQESDNFSEEDDSKIAEIFYIHGNGYYDKANWNADIHDADATIVLEQISIPNEIGPFFTVGEIFAPRYRQSTLFSKFTHKYDGVASQRLAYTDVRAAFIQYLSAANPERPLILVGYEQGGLYLTGLLREFFANNKELHERLAAAYVINYGVPVSLVENNHMGVPACQSPEQTGCLISYNAYEASLIHEVTRTRNRTLMIDSAEQFTTVTDEEMLCINPLSWTSTKDYIDAKSHRGGASATGLVIEQEPPIIKQAIGAQCVEGVLIVDKPEKRFLRRKHWFGQQWRAQSFNLFYADLREDALRRVDIHRPVLAENIRQLDPIAIDGSIEVGDSPINKVPD